MTKELLKVENLMNTYYDADMDEYTLEFQKDGKNYLVRVDAREHEAAKDDEYYFDNEEIIAGIVENISEEDIEAR